LKRHLIFILFWGSYLINYAQINEIYRLDEPGLFSDGYELCFDSKGFMWLATDKGLFKYQDYKSFKNVHPDTLYPKVVYSLLIDSLDRKWFIDLNQKINVCEEEDIKLFEPFVDHYVSTYSFDEEHQVLTIYIENSIDTIAKFNADENFKLIPFGLQYADGILFKLKDFEGLEVMPGYIVDSTLYNICRHQPQDFCEQINISNLRLLTVVHKGPYLFIIADAEDKFLMFDKRNGNLQLNHEISNLIENTRIKSIQYVGNSIYIINTYNGSYLFEASKQNLQFIPESSGLICANIQYYQNSIWISTTLNGVYSSKLYGIKFLDPLASSIFSLDDNGILYVGEKGALKIFDGTEFVDQINVSKRQHIYNFTNLDSQMLVHLSNQAIYSLEKETSNLTKIKARGHYTIKHKDNVFSASYGGFGRYEYITNLSSYLSNFNRDDAIKINSKRYRKFISNDNSDYIYLGGKSGLDKYNTITDEISVILSGSSIQDLVEENQDQIWVGTIGNGVWKIQNDSITQVIDKNNYLYKVSANALLIDRHQLWVGTDKGLITLDAENYDSKKVSKSDGLIYDNIIGLAQTDSILYIFTNQGLFYLNKQDSIVSNSAPKCYISGIKINQQDTILKANYTLTNNQNDISINFYTNDINSYGENTLKYRLASIDSSWMQSNGNINSVRYQDLKHGSYKFEAYSSLPDERQKSNIVEVSFEIERPLHEKWWFRSTTSLIIALFSISFALFFANSKNKLLKLKNELQLEKMNSLIQQMNPHFIYNTLNAIQYFIFKEEKIEAAKYLANFSGLVRKNFEYSNCEFISLEKEIEHIKNYLIMEEVRFEDKVEIELIIQDSLHAKDLIIPPFFIQPFIPPIQKVKFGYIYIVILISIMLE